MIVDVNAGILHRVGGGRYTWNPKVNFSDWASRERFYSGDWLYFGFDSTRHNILQVNKSSYEQCINIDFISNVTRGGRDVFQLFQPKPYYFICGRGYCHQGMKLTVNVLPKPAPSTPTELPPQPPLLSYPQTLLPLLLWPFSPSPLRLHTSTRSCFFSGPFLLHVTKY
ncbi:hypothetical protein F2Q70_00014445 [Brassica cretica]|uniref:Phytocyanin domain-containing protein n=1 Tax=Brassica cretica TaxID=69181 RepID=A0A8S9HZ20_BRACR|nr:hypothetical protein F2Q70_00014445 [Brassica cretica]KAF2596564.1 hypothetical protein F2Q68_00007456 [Brassica cretica]